MGELAEGVAAQHPELGMRVVDDQWPGQNLIRRSDQWNFMTHGVPALFFHSGLHPDYHFPSDHADLLDYLKTERIVQLVFYIGLRLASADQTPD
jgi:Zn-dependent M28 family amino/carboxypeptidase